MQQVFLRGLFITLLLNLLVKPATIFFVDVAIQNKLGSEEYGVFQTMLNFTFLFSMLLDMGITNYMTRLIAQHPQLIRRYNNKLFTLRVILAGVYCIWTISLFFILALPLEWFWILGALLLHQVSTITVNYVRAYTGGLMRFSLDAMLSVTERFIYLILGLILLYSTFIEPLTLEWFVGAFVTSSFCSFLVASGIYVSIVGYPTWKWRMPYFRAVFKQSFPFALLVILMMLYTRLDAVFLARLHNDGARQVGYYVQGFRLLDACWMFGILFGGLLLPIFSRLIKEQKSVSSIMTHAFNLLISAGILMIVLSMGMLETLFTSLYKDVSAASYQSWIFLSFSFLPMCFTIVFGTLLTAKGLLKQLNIIAGFGLFITIVGSLLIVPNYGAVGTAIITCITQIVVGVLQWVIVHRTMGEKLQQFAWIRLGALAGLMGGLLSAQLTFHWSVFMWFMLSTSVWGIALLGFKILNVKAVLGMLGKGEE